jgi:hypothetical protein
MLSFDLTDTDTPDQAADTATNTLRFAPVPAPDATSFYDLGPMPKKAHYVGRTTLHRRRLIRTTRQDLDGLRAALDAGWDVGREVAHIERRLSSLIATDHAVRGE